MPVLPMVAVVLLLLLHAPLPEGSLRDVKEPTQARGVPEIGAGAALTAIAVVIKQPVGNVYVIVVEPANMLLTAPEVIPVVAIDVLLLARVPPLIPSDKVVDCPTHMLVVPLTGDGNGFTVMIIDAAQPPLIV